MWKAKCLKFEICIADHPSLKHILLVLHCTDPLVLFNYLLSYLLTILFRNKDTFYNRNTTHNIQWSVHFQKQFENHCMKTLCSSRTSHLELALLWLQHSSFVHSSVVSCTPPVCHRSKITWLQGFPGSQWNNPKSLLLLDTASDHLRLM